MILLQKKCKCSLIFETGIEALYKEVMKPLNPKTKNIAAVGPLRFELRTSAV
jgi:hypothetical protein